MEYINTEDFCLKHTCVTLGKFDGVHLGHRLLLQQLTKERESSGRRCVVFTFDFSSGISFSGSGGSMIYTAEEKRKILEDIGIDVLVAYPFTKTVKEIEAEDFIRQILVRKLGAGMIAVGSDNRFGHNRRGDVAMLKAFAKQYDFHVIVCDKVRDKGGIISSTRIRGEIEAGHIQEANALLGRPYHMLSRIEYILPVQEKPGEEQPRFRLFPPKGKLLPPEGAYKTRTVLPCGAFYGVTNINCIKTRETDREWIIETQFIKGQIPYQIPHSIAWEREKMQDADAVTEFLS